MYNEWTKQNGSTVIMLARGFNMPLTEFLDDDIFRLEDLEVEQ